MILWNTIPDWQVIKSEDSFLIKVANTREITFPVTLIREDKIEFDAHYTKAERLIGYSFRLKDLQVHSSPWYVWAFDLQEEVNCLSLPYQDKNVRLLKFHSSKYLLVMRWRVNERESNVRKSSLSY